MSVDIWHLPQKDIERLKGSRVVLSMSGGKDSTAVALLLERNGIDFDCVFMDTGWEHPSLYKYIDEVLEPRFGPVVRLKSEKKPDNMADWIRRKGFFPSAHRRYCTKELKIIPFQKYIRSIEDDVIYVVGIRREESRNRSSAERWDYNENTDCDVFRPLVEHSFDDVIRMHQEAGIAPNPLYLQGASRVGCFPCIFARKEEVDQVAKLWPQRIDEIAALEEELAENSKRRYREDPEFKAKTDDTVKAWAAYEIALKPKGVSRLEFQSFRKGKSQLDEGLVKSYNEAREVGPGHAIYDSEFERFFQRRFFTRVLNTRNPSIREVVEWSKTARGGRQLKLFDLGARDGCMRWGMCESPLADEELVKIREPDSE